VSDRGTAFTSLAFEKYCESHNIQHLLIATGVPRGNGQVERLHKIVVPVLAKLSYERTFFQLNEFNKLSIALSQEAPVLLHSSF